MRVAGSVVRGPGSGSRFHQADHRVRDCGDERGPPDPACVPSWRRPAPSVSDPRAWVIEQRKTGYGSGPWRGGGPGLAGWRRSSWRCAIRSASHGIDLLAQKRSGTRLKPAFSDGRLPRALRLLGPPIGRHRPPGSRRAAAAAGTVLLPATANRSPRRPSDRPPVRLLSSPMRSERLFAFPCIGHLSRGWNASWPLGVFRKITGFAGLPPLVGGTLWRQTCLGAIAVKSAMSGESLTHWSEPFAEAGCPARWHPPDRSIPPFVAGGEQPAGGSQSDHRASPAVAPDLCGGAQRGPGQWRPSALMNRPGSWLPCAWNTNTSRSQYMRMRRRLSTIFRKRKPGIGDLALQITFSIPAKFLPVSTFDRARRSSIPQSEEAQACTRRHQVLYEQLVKVVQAAGMARIGGGGKCLIRMLHRRAARAHVRRLPPNDFIVE